MFATKKGVKAPRHRAIEKGTPTVSESVTRDQKLTAVGGLGGLCIANF